LFAAAKKKRQSIFDDSNHFKNETEYMIDSIMNLIDSILTLKIFFLLQLLRIIVKKLILRKKANYKRIGLRSDIGTRKKSCN